MIGVVAVAAVSVVVVAFVINASVPAAGPPPDRSVGAPPEDVPEPDDVVIMGQARDFLRYSAQGEVITACAIVADNGGFTNPCENDLSKRADYKTLRRLDPELEVTGFDRKGNVATITGKQITPAPAVTFSIQVVLTDRGEWKVRNLNGRPITFEGDF